jgi:hypothetical protein
MFEYAEERRSWLEFVEHTKKPQKSHFFGQRTQHHKQKTEIK